MNTSCSAGQTIARTKEANTTVSYMRCMLHVPCGRVLLQYNHGTLTQIADAEPYLLMLLVTSTSGTQWVIPAVQQGRIQQDGEGFVTYSNGKAE